MPAIVSRLPCLPRLVPCVARLVSFLVRRLPAAPRWTNHECAPRRMPRRQISYPPPRIFGSALHAPRVPQKSTRPHLKSFLEKTLIAREAPAFEPRQAPPQILRGGGQRRSRYLSCTHPPASSSTQVRPSDWRERPVRSTWVSKGRMRSTRPWVVGSVRTFRPSVALTSPVRDGVGVGVGAGVGVAAGVSGVGVVGTAGASTVGTGPGMFTPTSAAGRAGAGRWLATASTSGPDRRKRRMTMPTTGTASVPSSPMARARRLSRAQRSQKLTARSAGTSLPGHRIAHRSHWTVSIDSPAAPRLQLPRAGNARRQSALQRRSVGTLILPPRRQRCRGAFFIKRAGQAAGGGGLPTRGAA